MKIVLFPRRKVNKKSLAIISGNISSLYNAGIPFVTILDLIQELPLSKDYRISMDDIKKEIITGGSLYDGFALNGELYPSFFLSMLRIGEKTGKMTEVLNGLYIYYEKMSLIEKKIISSLTYPIILIISLVFMMIFVLVFAIPSFGELYSSLGKEVPGIFKFIININILLKRNIFFTLLIIVSWGILIPLLLFKEIYNKKIKKSIYNTRVVKEFFEYISIVYLMIIFQSGISLSNGFYICTETQIFKEIKSIFISLSGNVSEGKSINEAMRLTNKFSNYTIANVKLGEESGGLDNQLMIVERELFKRFFERINRSVSLLGPSLIVFIGVIVVVFILNFLMPVFDVFTQGV